MYQEMMEIQYDILSDKTLWETNIRENLKRRQSLDVSRRKEEREYIIRKYQELENDK